MKGHIESFDYHPAFDVFVFAFDVFTLISYVFVFVMYLMYLHLMYLSSSSRVKGTDISGVYNPHQLCKGPITLFFPFHFHIRNK